MSLQGKRIIVGISGGIAAYKTLTLVRLLVKAGAQVRCVCTPSALEFVTPLSLSTLCGSSVYSDIFALNEEKTTKHISFSEWGDLLVVAPATANTLAKFANGIADNALSTLFMAFDKPVLVAPAMNTRMYRHPATQANLQKLQSWGVHIMQAASGALACGSEGVGRMPEAEEIFARVQELSGTAYRSVFKRKKVLVTAGPTVEAIDPVRYISNHSTGMMGCRIADELTARGAEVYLVHGPMLASPKRNPYRDIPVTTAAQMCKEATALWPEMDMAVLSAAVADYTPAEPSAQKIKKHDDSLHIRLCKTQDILATLGAGKKKDQLLVGFALETENELANAQEKLQRKNADLLVLNSLNDRGAGFAQPTNRVTFLDKAGTVLPMPLKSKEEVASDLADRMEEAYGKL
ncbi:MAG: bifunctional phosphopantothenoylcysteine decarboxylase/phosphopantothenate--cysteine ligase CoaBC [Bacteroides sp.]|nr:bifunctional phosphopantothenoylcysteine decarboxylase/phosphopantothenate--cysteine ligase CoaBC [Bacteroides sp.]